MCDSKCDGCKCDGSVAAVFDLLNQYLVHIDAANSLILRAGEELERAVNLRSRVSDVVSDAAQKRGEVVALGHVFKAGS